MKSKIILAALSIVVFSACNSDSNNEENINTPMTEQQAPSEVLENNNPTTTTLEVGPAAPTNAIEEAANKPAATNSSPSKTALNPEHGQPGHRCDLAVGAPLSSAPATPQNAPQIAPQPMNITPVTAPTIAEQPVDGNVKLNPAHGVPGHRCDIQVGAPLS